MGLDRHSALNVVDFATLTVGATAVGLDSASPAYSAGKVSGLTVRRMYITTETDAIRWRPDGTAPTSSVGHVLAVNDSISFTGADYSNLLANIKFIRVTNNATLSITFFD